MKKFMDQMSTRKSRQRIAIKKYIEEGTNMESVFAKDATVHLEVLKSLSSVQQQKIPLNYISVVDQK